MVKSLGEFIKVFCFLLILIAVGSCRNNSAKITMNESEESKEVISSSDNLVDDMLGKTDLKNDSIGDSSVNCNIDVVAKLNSVLENPSEQNILSFYYTFDKICENNVEFLEFGNEVLLELFYKHPEIALKCLSKVSANFDLILKELNNPVTDKFSVRDVQKNIRDVSNSIGVIKIKVLEVLKVE